MQGRTHAASGALAGVGIAAAWHFGLPLEAASAVIGAGAALLPDLDHADAAAVHALGPAGRAISGAVAKLGGGHRGKTHTAAFALFVGALAGAAALAGHVGATVVVAVLAALGIRTLLMVGAGKNRPPWLRRRTRRGLVLLGTAGASVGAWHFGLSPLELGSLAAAGVAAHLAGDLVSNGVPLLWPLRKERVVLARLHTFGTVDRLLAPALTAAVVALLIGPLLFRLASRAP